MRNADLRSLTLRLSEDVRDGRFVPDWDLGKAEYLGDAEEKAEAYGARVRPLLEVYHARGLVTDAELPAYLDAAVDPQALADRLQVLAETLPPGG